MSPTGDAAPQGEVGRSNALPVIISVVIPVYNGAGTLRRCLESVAASAHRPDECIVVDDGSTDGSADVARAFGARVLTVAHGPSGPANARNLGAGAARGDVLFFVDADVILHIDTIAKMAETFAADPMIDAVFGSYDDNPEAVDFLSRYKNLFHHFVHQQARGEAVTFWGACGAVRRDVFLALGGFDAVRYPRPSIEDIDLGYRLQAAGRRIALNKAMQIQHCKRWTMRNLLKTEIFDRGIPWTRLALRERRLPNDLNLAFSQRLSALLVCGVLSYLGLIAFFHDGLMLPLLVALFVLIAGNWSEDTPHFQMSRLAQGLTYLLVVAIAALAWRSGQTRMIPFLGMLVFGLMFDRWTPHAAWRLRRAVFGTIVLGLLVSVFVVLKHFSMHIGAPLLLFVFGIMAINYRFYRFFVQKQGLAFTLAVVAFHLLYYLYSLVAFVFGVGLYLFVDGRRRLERIPSGLRSPADARGADSGGAMEATAGSSSVL